MNTILHTADTCGSADHGWLHSHHTFSFAQYYNPERMQFGALRVLNDDIIDGGEGFGMHPHNNMEIVTIVLEGALEHSDSMGNTEVIRKGDIQVMSAGTGITHSEYNKNKDIPVSLLQIWVVPNAMNVEPRYSQITLKPEEYHNTLLQIISPHADEGMWIHQNAWFHVGVLDEGVSIEYHPKVQGNGIYIFVIKGIVMVNDQELHFRDGYGVVDTEKVSIMTKNETELLVMEVPMIS